MIGFWDNAEIIHSYTRAEAIRDGVLVDAGDAAKEAGFRFPVTGNQAYQDESGRLWDVLTMARHATKRGAGEGDRARFQVLRVPNTPQASVARLLELEMHIGPGDDGSPVITIGLPGQD